MNRCWIESEFNFYIAGLFDANGGIYYNKKYVNIIISGLSKKTREFVKNMLGFGIVHPERDIFLISKKLDCLKFLYKIENYSIEKSEKIKECICFLEKSIPFKRKEALEEKLQL